MTDKITERPVPHKPKPRKRPVRKRRRLEYRVSAVIFMSVVFFISCFAWFMIEANSNGIKFYENADGKNSAVEVDSTAEQTQAPGNSSQSERVKPDVKNPAPETPRAAAEYTQKCAFVGNALPASISDDVGISSDKVYSAPTLKASELETKIMSTVYGECNVLHALKKQNPEIIYIMLSASAISFDKTDEELQAVAEFTSILSASFKTSSICVTSLPPVSSKAAELEETPVKNTDVDAFNAKLLEMCNKNKLHYIAMGDALKGEDGFLADTYASDTGGLNSKAPTALASYLLTHAIV